MTPIYNANSQTKRWSHSGKPVRSSELSRFPNLRFLIIMKVPREIITITYNSRD